MATRKTKAPAPAVPDKASTLHLTGDGSKSDDRRLAEAVMDGVVGNSATVVKFAAGTFGSLSLSECMLALQDSGRAINSGDMRSAETMLTAQAAALNAIFCELARRAGLNMGEYIDATDRYMRLALKAQGQCRATLETLAAIKNPPVVFAKQANINNGGQQQVNNGAQPAGQAPAQPVGGRGGESPPLPEAETPGCLACKKLSPLQPHQQIRVTQPVPKAD